MASSLLLSSSRGLCVDIDDTVADTAVTVARIVGTRFGFPQQMTASDLMRSDDQPGHVRAWQNPEVTGFLERLLGNSDFLRTLPCIPEANSALCDIAHQLPICCYISSRSVDHLHTTTLWLADHEFPKAPVVLRDPLEQRVDWKLDVLLTQFPESFGLIDNEKALCFSKIPYKGRRFWFDRYDTRAVLSSSIISISSWRAMSKWVNDFASS